MRNSLFILSMCHKYALDITMFVKWPPFIIPNKTRIPPCVSNNKQKTEHGAEDRHGDTGVVRQGGDSVLTIWTFPYHSNKATGWSLCTYMVQVVYCSFFSAAVSITGQTIPTAASGILLPAAAQLLCFSRAPKSLSSISDMKRWTLNCSCWSDLVQGWMCCTQYC